MASGSLLQIYPYSTKPSAPPAGSYLMYMKTDNVIYLQDSSGTEYAFGATGAITALTGEGTASGPGSSVLTLSNSAVIGKVLSGFSPGPNSTVLSTDTILQAFQKLQAQVTASGLGITALTGDVSATGPGSVAATVNSVGGSSAANIHTAELATNSATSTNTASKIVLRDASGNFAANTISASLNGNASTATSAISFSGSLAGDVTGPQATTVVSSVGGKTSTQVAQSVTDTQAATSANTASVIVKRDASGNFAANTITANLTGNASGTAANITGVVTVAHGGTNSSTALSNNRIIQSSAGAIVEAAAITAARALISDANGIPTQSATTSTELGFVSGVTSSIQTQINSISGSGITSLTGDVVATGPGASASTIQSNVVSNSKLAQMAANTLKGNNTGSTANAADLTVSQVVAMSSSTAVSQTTNQSNAAGTAPFFARADHIHNIATDVPVQIGTSNNAGSSAKFAAADHVHALTPSVTTGQLLTGLTTGTNTPITATNSILTGFQNLQAQVSATSGAAITGLTGDVTAAGPGNVAGTISVGAVTDTKASLAVKPAVTLVAVTNQTLTGTPTIDGQATTAAQSIVLLTAQTTTSQNGPWVVQTGAWTRPTWYPSGGTTQAFQFITTFVRLGTIYGGSEWRQTAAAPITIDTTTTTWTVTPISGNFKSPFIIGPQSGVLEVDLKFANANTGTLGWNPTSSIGLILPPTQGTAGTYLSNDGTGTLSWSNPIVNIDGGTASSIYTAGQFINGGTA